MASKDFDTLKNYFDIMPTRRMKINFNGVRKNACLTHDKLVRALNKCKTYEDYILVDPNILTHYLGDLRSLLCVIASTYVEGDDDFKDVFSELYMEGSDKMMEVLKLDEEDEE